MAFNPFDFNRDGFSDISLDSFNDLEVMFGGAGGSFSEPTVVAQFSPDIPFLRTYGGVRYRILKGTVIDSTAQTVQSFQSVLQTTVDFSPGSYVARLAITAASGQAVAIAKAPFSVLKQFEGGTPAQILETRIVTDKFTYLADEFAKISATVANASVNTTVSGLTIKVSVLNVALIEIFTQTLTGVTLLPGQVSTLNPVFAVALNAPGSYTAKLQVFQNGTLLKESAAVFTILETVKLTGTLTPSPASVNQGTTFSASFTIHSASNVAILGATVQILVANAAGTVLATHEQTPLNITPGQTVSGTFSALPTAGLPPGNLMLALRVVKDANVYPVAAGAITVLLQVFACPYFDFALYSSSSIKVSDKSSVSGSVYAKSSISVSDNAVIDGDAKTSGGANSIKVTNKARITGSKITGAPVINLPSVDAIVNAAALSNNNISIGLTAKGRNPVDKDKKFSLSDKDSITLNSGFYYFKGIHISDDSTLKISGNVFIFLDGPFKISKGRVDTVSADAPVSLFIVSRSIEGVKIADTAFVKAGILAPNAEMHLSDSAMLVGAAAAKLVRVSDKTVTKFKSNVKNLCAALGLQSP